MRAASARSPYADAAVDVVAAARALPARALRRAREAPVRAAAPSDGRAARGVGAIREIVGERLADVSIATLALAADRA
jgi:hypothetical protein